MTDTIQQNRLPQQPEQAQQDGNLIAVEVAYATPEKQSLISLEVPAGTTALEAVRQSGITDEFPAINLERDPMGIFSNLLNGKDWPLPSDYVMQQHDRLEIYRPLQIDPKQARLDRAKKKQTSPSGRETDNDRD